VSITGPRKVVAIVGAGDAIGAAVARRFAKGGYTICLIRRSWKKPRHTSMPSSPPAAERRRSALTPATRELSPSNDGK
jgi:NAD(P)-dependent dehydrogenase (short-subunit alcohol dehydrogenase family)